jgi:hypothetical protein
MSDNEPNSATLQGVICSSKEFLDADAPLPGLDGRTVGDFWRWAYSDVMSNRNRSIFAEFIVGVALGVVERPRVEWDAVDLQYGGFKIEVKSSAYCQSWFQSKPSTIQFGIRKAIFWNLETGRYEGEAVRSADVYVFCLHGEKDKSKANVLDVTSWDFYVVLTEVLNRNLLVAKSISLAALKRLAAPCTFVGLKAAVDQALHAPEKDEVR